MSRYLALGSALAVAVALTLPVSAAVKTRQKVSVKFEGMMGRMMSMAGMGGDPTTSTVSVVGQRMSTFDDRSGQIVDLAEERVYQVDMRRKEYTITTFAQMRQQMEEARKRLAEQSQSMDPQQQAQAEQAADAFEVDVDVKETGETKKIADQATKQVILTLTLRQKDQTLEQGGGFVMTNDMWLAPRVAALDELSAFQLKFAQAVFGEALGMDPRQASSISALIPAFGSLATRMAEEGKKLEGTALLTTSTLETVKSEAQLEAASQSGGGGIGGALAGRFMRGRNQPRSTTMTSTHEMLSISSTVADADVAVPAGFKEKK
jgi:hypothetical protein